jgi:hypothetical protein
VWSLGEGVTSMNLAGNTCYDDDGEGGLNLLYLEFWKKWGRLERRQRWRTS